MKKTSSAPKRTEPKRAEADVLTAHERTMKAAHAPIVAMGGWPLEVAFAAANMAEDVSYRLVAALVLIRHIEDPDPDFPADGGWTLEAVRDIVDGCRRDLLSAITEDQQAAGGVQ